MKLFKQLFWLILIPYCIIGIFMAPLIGIIKGTFSDNFRSKLCLRQSISEFDVIKHNIVPLISPLVATATATYFEFRSKRYLKGMCPNGNMYGIGNYRRNFATFEDTVRWLHVFSSISYCTKRFSSLCYKYCNAVLKPMHFVQTSATYGSLLSIKGSASPQK